jgi:hypothetical protein
LIDVKTISGKTAFNIVKSCKTKGHPDGNAAAAWEKLKNKYEPVSAPTLLKLEKQFREFVAVERMHTTVCPSKECST